MNTNNCSFRETNCNKYNEKNNCMKFCENDFSLYHKTKLIDDKCYNLDLTKQSTASGNYMLNNFHSCDCKMENVINTATQNPLITFRDGYGVSDCNIDESSTLRVGKVRKYPKCKNQLFQRPYSTIPYMGRGSGNSDIESKLLPGESTVSTKACNTLSGISIENQFTPLVPNLLENIQEPENLIQETVDTRWIRGGVPSRQFVKDIDYLERCGNRIKDNNYLSMKFNN